MKVAKVELTHATYNNATIPRLADADDKFDARQQRTTIHIVVRSRCYFGGVGNSGSDKKLNKLPLIRDLLFSHLSPVPATTPSSGPIDFIH